MSARFPGRIGCPDVVDDGSRIPVSIELHDPIDAKAKLSIWIDDELVVQAQPEGALRIDYLAVQVRLQHSASLHVRLEQEGRLYAAQHDVTVQKGQAPPETGERDTRARLLRKSGRIYLAFQNSMSKSHYLKEVRLLSQAGAVKIFPTPHIAGPAAFGIGIVGAVGELTVEATGS